MSGIVLRVSRFVAGWRGLALATVLGVVMAVVTAPAGIASASVAPHGGPRPGGHAVSGTGLSLAQAPAGLRAAVHRTLGIRAASAGSPFQQAELTDPGSAEGDRFGISVAIAGSTAVVGAKDANRNGAAYVFVRSGGTWSQQAELTDPSATAYDQFGASVAISGSTAVVGAVGVNSSAGAAYVFVRSGGTWSQQAALTDPGGAAYDQFGISVAIAGSTAVVGAVGENNFAGAAYVFTGSGGTWSQQAGLTPAGGAPSDSFYGQTVAIAGSTVAVGAPRANNSSGAVYVFTGSGGTWSQQADLTDPGGAANDYFGESVAISGSTMVVGVPEENSSAGVAYVFVRSGGTWSQQAELASPGSGLFGISVAITGSTAVVGGYATDSWAGAAYVFARSGHTWPEQAELTAADGASTGEFGASVALSGSTALVGEPNTNSAAGAVYAYALPSQQARLGAAGRDANQNFATSVALSGSTAVVGAPGQNSATGAAYVYVRTGSTWTQQAELTDPGSAPADDFGLSVALSGTTAVVGAPGTTSGTGAAYVFTDSGGTWSRQATLTAADGAPGDIFGHAVAISGSAVVVGAYGTNSSTGTAYVFARNAGIWSQQAQLTDPGGAANDNFGSAVAISGSTAVIGAYGTNASTGAAYLFTRSGSAWSQQATLSDPGAAPGDCFGYAVALSGTTAMVGAPGTNSVTGAAYVFTGSGSTWTRQATLTAANGAAGDDFGYAVALSRTTAVVGAPRQDSRTGTAYLFAGSGGSWSQQAELTATDGATGDQFGASVAFAGPTAVLGAPGKNSSTGTAYVFANV